MADHDTPSSLQQDLSKSSTTPAFDAASALHDRAAGQDAEARGREKAFKKIREKPLKAFGAFCLVVFVLTIFSTTTPVDHSEAAQNALKNKVSTSLSAGTLLLTKDENITPQDYTITHSESADETKIWIWDYAAEDGDYVQILVNGAPVGEAFMIKHKPRELTVPAVGTVQVKGIRDGGGGITYAVHYDLNGTNYFNSAPEGEFNTYTLTRM